MDYFWSIKAFLFFICQICMVSTTVRRSSYTAAVLQHAPKPYTSTPLHTMLANAEVYAENAKRAAELGSDLLVFPEYGMFGWDPFEESSKRINEYLVYLPRSADGWTPCLAPDEFADGNGTNQVLYIMSCAALNNSLVLVVNLLTKEPCDTGVAKGCPAEGFFAFNTNLVFGKDGSLIARYHKQHPFDEAFLTPTPEPEAVIIDLGFAKFGIFTCWDMVFEHPTIDYITQHGIRNLIFSTAWGNELPFLTSATMFARFARSYGINLIASNAYIPPYARLGSGIYSTLGAVNETNDLSVAEHLLIAELPVDPLPVASKPIDCIFLAEAEPQPIPSHNSTFILSTMNDKPSSKPIGKILRIWNQSLRNFSSHILSADEGNITLCDSDLCCHLDYNIIARNNTHYVLAVLNGIHYFFGDQLYVQICSVLRCESDDDIETCGRVPQKPTSAVFSRFSLTGGFQTPALFPGMLGTDLGKIPDGDWTFTKDQCPNTNTKFSFGGTITSSSSKPLLVASIYGRVFDRD